MSASKSTSRVPSHRDQEIFRRVVANGESQSANAAELRLTPGRISQIVARVRRWLAAGADVGPSTTDLGPRANANLDATFSNLECQRLERALAKTRHEHLYQLAVREIDRQSKNPQHTTIRTEIQPNDADSPTPDSQPPTPSKIVTTVRDQPLNVQLIKAAQRSAIELQKLADLDPLPPPPPLALPTSPTHCPSSDRRALLDQLLTEHLEAAVASHKVRSVYDEAVFAQDLLKFLLGEPHLGIGAAIVASDRDLGRLRDPDNHSLALPTSPTPSSAPLTNTKPSPTDLDDPEVPPPPPPLAPTPAPASTSAYASSPAATPDSPPPPRKKSPTFSPPPPGSWSFQTPYLPPYDHAEYDRLFHPWTRDF